MSRVIHSPHKISFKSINFKLLTPVSDMILWIVRIGNVKISPAEKGRHFYIYLPLTGRKAENLCRFGWEINVKIAGGIFGDPE